ncbi:MAG: hypothetical protein IKG79_00815 [Neisseriaceae bacterium]|nr:hypothetical protein [Neisseriaceae bacterium]
MNAPFCFDLPNITLGIFVGMFLFGVTLVVFEISSNKTQATTTAEYKITDARIQHFTIDGIECIAINRYGISCDWHNRKLSGVTK